MIETSKYTRKPFEVEAIQVTAENMDEVAQWCGGTVTTEGDTKFIKVEIDRVLNERQTKAFIGDWVLKQNDSYKIYTSKAFRKSFELIKGAVGQALAEAQDKKVSIAVG